MQSVNNIGVGAYLHSGTVFMLYTFINLKEPLHVFTKAVLLFAAGLTINHQVRHLHSNLCLLLHFLLLSDLERNAAPVYTLMLTVINHPLVCGLL